MSLSNKRIGWLALGVIALVLIADQWIKIWVKTSFYMGEDLPIFSWWHLKFIENNGMAFGMQLWNKVVLTVGRIIAVGILSWVVVKCCRLPKVRVGFIVALALITAGAAGNIFDCVFYGVVFDNPPIPEVAQAFPKGGGYAPWFEGRVVDMMYFPLFSFVWPEWVPFFGGEEFEFFQYIFNVADASICVGVGLLLFFYSKDVSDAYAMLTKKVEVREERRREK